MTIPEEPRVTGEGRTAADLIEEVRTRISNGYYPRPEQVNEMLSELEAAEQIRRLHEVATEQIAAVLIAIERADASFSARALTLEDFYYEVRAAVGPRVSS